MSSKKEVLAIVPARAGSKGVPHKNRKHLNGKPLIAYTFEAAKGSENISRVVLTTDDEEVIEIAKAYGVEVPFKRPSKLSTDEAGMLPVVEHVLEELSQKQNYEPDYLILLQPTCPFRTHEHIDEAFRLLMESPEAEAVVSFTNTEYSPYLMKKIDEKGMTSWLFPEFEGTVRRQDLSEVYRPSGLFYGISLENFKKYKTFYPPKTKAILFDRTLSINIDDPLDWTIAESLMGLQERKN